MPAAAATAAAARQACVCSYRTILRHLRLLPSASHNDFAQVVTQRFREGKEVTDAGKVAALRQTAMDVSRLVTGVDERQVLVDLYNGEKMVQSERMTKSAARVGLNMPEEYHTDQEKRNGPNGESGVAYKDRMDKKTANAPIL